MSGRGADDGRAPDSAASARPDALDPALLPADVDEGFAAVAAWLHAAMPEPRVVAPLPHGGLSLHGGDPVLCVARLSASGVRIGPARLRFWGTRAVLVEVRVAALPWSMMPRDAAAAAAVFGPLVAAAVALRRAELVACGRCGVARDPAEAAIVASTSGACPFCLRP